jgi:hypothetical protein
MNYQMEPARSLAASERSQYPLATGDGLVRLCVVMAVLVLLAQAKATEEEGVACILDARFSSAYRVLEIRVSGLLARAGASYCSQADVSQVPQGLRPVQDHACVALGA